MMSLEDVARKQAEDLKNAASESARKKLEDRQREVWKEVQRWSDKLGGVVIEDFQYKNEQSGAHLREAIFTVDGRSFALEYYYDYPYSPNPYFYLLHGGKKYSASAWGNDLAQALEDIQRDDEIALTAPKPKKRHKAQTKVGVGSFGRDPGHGSNTPITSIGSPDDIHACTRCGRNFSNGSGTFHGPRPMKSCKDPRGHWWWQGLNKEWPGPARLQWFGHV